MSDAEPFLHGLENPGPQLASAGRVSLAGWCAARGSTRSPLVRLVCGGTVFPAEDRSPPSPAPAGLPPGTPVHGFVCNGEVAPGAHVACLEASLDGSAWRCLRRFVLAASSGTLSGAIHWPAETGAAARQPLHGWCAHPHVALAAVELHRGNRRVRCEHGLASAEAARVVPGSPDAAHAGFVATAALAFAHGPLRIKAIDTGGRVHILELACPDESRTSAPAADGRTGRGAGPRRILFVLYGDMTANSAFHVAALADRLVEAGHECVVAVPRDAETIRHHRHPKFHCVSFAECGERGAVFRSGAGPDLVHAWTTAECVRRFALAVRAASGARLVVHLEDHEGAILATATGRTAAELERIPAAELDALVGDHQSHPRHRAAFLGAADGCTAILDRLVDLIPPGKPVQVIRPAAAPEFHARPIPWPRREALGWGRDHTVLFYHGNLHPANRPEMAELHEAVVRLNATGVPTTLLRTGRDFCALPGDLADRCAPHVVALSHIAQQRHLAPLLAYADCFVQPGLPDTFNNYRFPSKLPEFFCSGRPVILPRTNLGTVVRHGVDAYVLDRGDAAGIADAIRALRANPDLAARLAAGAEAFAREHFSWERSAAQLAAFYAALPTAPSSC